MKIKLEETKKEFTPLTVEIQLETPTDVITFRDMLDCVDSDTVKAPGLSLADKLLHLIKDK